MKIQSALRKLSRLKPKVEALKYLSEKAIHFRVVPTVRHVRIYEIILLRNAGSRILGENTLKRERE